MHRLFINIAPLTTMQLPVMAEVFYAKNVDHILEFFNKLEKGVKPIILGGGSNLIISPEIKNRPILKMEIMGIEIISNERDFVLIKLGAGENWDNFVSRACATNLSGIEAMSAIPGTVGATPVQNVGAYGQEVKDTILNVEVFDIEDKKIKILTNVDCKFSYRDSIFKNEGKNKFVIISVTFKLLKQFPEIPKYVDVKKYFIENNINNPSLIQIRDAIINIRHTKLPDPKIIFNTGSFFKNPIIDKNEALKIKESYLDMPSFTVISNANIEHMSSNSIYEQVKIPAGWLIEKVGMKGYDFGKVATYKNNAIVLINKGDASYQDIINAKDKIIASVYEKFGITLETEPEFVN